MRRCRKNSRSNTRAIAGCEGVDRRSPISPYGILPPSPVHRVRRAPFREQSNVRMRCAADCLHAARRNETAHGRRSGEIRSACSRTECGVRAEMPRHAPGHAGREDCAHGPGEWVRLRAAAAFEEYAERKGKPVAHPSGFQEASRASAWCRTSIPFTRKSTSSAIFVAWSAIRSRCCTMKSMSIARLMVVRSSCMNAINSL